MKKKSEASAKFALTTAKSKGKKIVLTAHNKAYDVKKTEKREKAAEKAKKVYALSG